MEKTITGIEGRIYRCKKCKFVKRVDVPFFYNVFETNSHMGYKRHTTPKRYENFEEPKCSCVRPQGFHMSYVIVKGVKTEQKCGAKCLNAVGPSCECSCGGHNHGRGH